MDWFVQVIKWIGGYAVFVVLGLTFVFSMAAASQTNALGLKVVALISGSLTLLLIGLAFKRFFFV